jgi:hypothetical protein
METGYDNCDNCGRTMMERRAPGKPLVCRHCKTRGY